MATLSEVRVFKQVYPKSGLRSQPAHSISLLDSVIMHVFMRSFFLLYFVEQEQPCDWKAAGSNP